VSTRLHPHRALAALAAVAALTLSAGAAAASPTASAPSSASATTRTVVSTGVPTAGSRIVAVGDIARSGGAQSRTAAVAAKRLPQRVVALGDLAYSTGSKSNFANYYNPSYGRFKAITWAVPGNHEYMTSNALGFRSYFGVTGNLWWAHRIGVWTVIGLDSEKAGSATQLAWLKAALKKENGRPTIVVWHRPRFSTGMHRDATDTQKLWATAATDRDVRIVLWGHDHDYERMSVPVGSRAVQAFVVGTGGAELRPFAVRSRSITTKRIAGTYGVLDLRLRSTGWSWFFVRTDGTVADSGSRAL
jgi:hypothetical protein